MTVDTVEPTKNTAPNFAEVSICISRRARDILRTLKLRTNSNTFSETIDILFAVYQDWSKHPIELNEEKTNEDIKEELVPVTDNADNPLVDLSGDTSLDPTM